MRNDTVDVIRGFAMLLVVLGHTLSGTLSEYSNSLLFQAIWTLQMPLFIIISGYVTRYSHPITEIRALWAFIKKRTIAYLLPWVVWSIVVRGLIFNQAYFINIKNMLWHMDSGYWFLITIWSISMIFGIADFISNKYFRRMPQNLLSHLALSGIGLIVLAILGNHIGFSFLAIKLTLYYLPIYLIGYIYGQIQNRIILRTNIKTIINYIIIVSLGLWIASIVRYNFFSSGDNIGMALRRYASSILGCIAIIGLFTNTYSKSNAFSIFKWAGAHSLEIYLTHYLFLRLVPDTSIPPLTSINGFFSLIINFTLTLLLTYMTIKIIRRNKELNYLLYAKQL